MAFDPHKLMSWPFKDVMRSYDDRDTLLYALSIGLGERLDDERWLPFVYEKQLKALPTMLTVLGMTDIGFMTDPDIGLDLSKMLHGEAGLEIHAPLPATGSIVSRMRLVDLIDKGPQKGSLLYYERHIRNGFDNTALATERGCFILRGNGGFADTSRVAPTPHAIPDRPADLVCDLPTLPQSALLYRLTGDRNPLHADPDLAHAVGFPRPILHGACTFGIAGHALLKTLCDYDPTRFKRMDVRFAAPVFPGETLRTEIWIEDEPYLSFRSKVLERDKVVLDNGYAQCDVVASVRDRLRSSGVLA
ncbi:MULTISPECIES: MaoC/PaaZ C-terminal domain-containing protein [unclassified Beijerinckia]|uniref:MaoC/PaaZ C-terminal domain-containing protein n=1 Tax=unclassified Beijerinckia TaxID=2638183 RepID=UPI00089D0909|nr:MULTISPECIES: MaoC/PaaZ C-terminal domain-containing protein [unclassified Beijerinckia]MDH7799174.1 acyl dehydratase [Beijerinckia sp. GAS462]SED92939.1 Acyl dehydratase [Beijerinckia sp. 28-YEA-48]